MARRFGGHGADGLSQAHVVHANPKLLLAYEGNLSVFALSVGPRRFDKDPEGVIAVARAYAERVGVVGQ